MYSNEIKIEKERYSNEIKIEKERYSNEIKIEILEKKDIVSDKRESELRS